MPDVAIKPAQDQTTAPQIKREGESAITLGHPGNWLAAMNQEKKEQNGGQQQAAPPKTLAELAKEKEQKDAEAAKQAAAPQQVAPMKDYKASEARAAVSGASQQAVDTLNAIEKIGSAERDDRDIFKKAVSGLIKMVGGQKLVENILGGNFKADSMLAKVIGEVDDPKTLIEMYRAALPGGRKFNAENVKTVIAETNLMLQRSADLLKTLPADEVSPATNTVGALAQRFSNVTDKLAAALKEKKPFENKDFAEMLRIMAELRENGMAPSESMLNSKSMKDMNGLVNGKGEPSKQVSELLASGRLSVESRDKIKDLVAQIKSLDPKKNAPERTTALLKLYAEVLANTPEEAKK